MKRLISTIVLVIMLVFMTGCLEEFSGGFTAGATAMKVLAEQSQADLIDSINAINAEKAEIDALIEEIEDVDLKGALTTLVDEQAVEAINDLKSADWSDPKVAGGYIAAVLALLTAGYQKKKRMEEH